MATVGICLVFELRKFRSAIHQGHRRLVAAVNFGHKKTQPKLGRCVGYLSVVMPVSGWHNPIAIQGCLLLLQKARWFSSLVFR